MANTINTSLNQVPAIFKGMALLDNDKVLNFGAGRYPAKLQAYFDA